MSDSILPSNTSTAAAVAAVVMKPALVVTEAAVDGLATFWGDVCRPASKEIGQLLKDKVRNFRRSNVAGILEKSKRRLDGEQEGAGSPEAGGAKVHPRVIHDVIETGSWTDDDHLQEMWAGLLAASCSGQADDHNLVYTQLLGQLTSLHVKVLRFACQIAPKRVTDTGYPYADPIEMDRDQFMQAIGETDLLKVDVVLDHLRALALFFSGQNGGGFDPRQSRVLLSLTPLAMYLYVRCQGHRGSPIDYWGLKVDAVTFVKRSDPPTAGAGL